MTYALIAFMIAGATLHPTAVPAPDAVAAYHYLFTGNFWNKQLVHVDQTQTLQTSAGNVEMTQHDTASGRTNDSHGVLKSDGTISVGNANAPSNPFDPYNTIALLTTGARDYAMGATWSASLPVQIGPVATDTTLVSVDATVAERDGDTLTVDGSGRTSTVATYGEYQDPIDLTVQVAAQFIGGTLARADYKATEYVHAGPLSQTMTWTWSLTRQ